MLNFLKSLVMPSYMSKYRSMSVLFSVCILILSCYVFSLPIGNYYLQHKDTFLESEEVYMKALTSITEDNQEANEAAKVVFDAGLTMSGNGYVSIKEEFNKNYEKASNSFLSFEKEMKKLDDEGNETDETYVQKCYVTFGVYFYDDSVSTQEESEEPKTFLNSDIYKNFNAIEMVEHETQVLIVFLENYIYYQVGQMASEDAELTDEQKALYSGSSALTIPYTTEILFTDLSFDTNNIGTTASQLCDEVAHILSYNYAASNNMMYVLIQLIPSCILFPLVFVLLFWMFFKKNGQLKKFREYFNIYAICSVIPMIVCFIVGFFWIEAVRFFIYVSAIYYLFQLYKINSNQTLV